MAHIGGPSGGPTLVSQPSIMFSGTLAPASTVSAGPSHTCVVRDDGKLACFGSNGSGELLLGAPVANYGSSASEMLSLVNIGFHIDKIPTFTPALSLLVLSTGDVVPNTLGRKFHIVLVKDVPEISITTAIAGGVAPLSILVNDGHVNGVFATTPLTPKLLKIVLTGLGTTTYMVFLRSLRGVMVASGSAHTCVLTLGRVACFGVQNDELFFSFLLYFFLTKGKHHAFLGRDHSDFIYFHVYRTMRKARPGGIMAQT